MKERIIALDIGDRRIGIAVSDALGITAQPLCMIERIGYRPDVERIAKIAAEHHTKAILCGLPLNMDGSRGSQANKVADFARQLEMAGFSVVFWDERMTTVTAERALIEGGVRREQRRGLVDQTAAAIILEAYLNAMKKKEEASNIMNKEEASNMNPDNVVELIGEDGTPVQFEHLMTLEHKGRAYIMLTPVEPDTKDEEGSVVIMRIDKDDKGEDCYILEEDEAVLDTVFSKFLEAMEEDEADDDEEDEEEGEEESEE